MELCQKFFHCGVFSGGHQDLDHGVFIEQQLAECANGFAFAGARRPLQNEQGHGVAGVLYYGHFVVIKLLSSGTFWYSVSSARARNWLSPSVESSPGFSRGLHKLLHEHLVFAQMLESVRAPLDDLHLAVIAAGADRNQLSHTDDVSLLRTQWGDTAGSYPALFLERLPITDPPAYRIQFLLPPPMVTDREPAVLQSVISRSSWRRLCSGAPAC